MTECDTLNIHGIGKIQAFGYILAIGKLSRDVSHVSVNIVDLPFSKHDDINQFVGSSLSSCFSEKTSDCMNRMLDDYMYQSETSRNTGSPVDSYIQHGSHTYGMTLDETSSEYVFEMYLDSPQDHGIIKTYSELIENIMGSSTKDDLYDSTCSFIAETLGYDRAIVYMFAEDMTGEVVYEWIDPLLQGSLEPFIGMHFPESDIPLPARAMYLVKPVRMLRDVLSDTVNLIGRSTLNLSRCITRASHEVHISYMKNMGIRSSMSMGIVKDDDLHGIISFHCYNRVVSPNSYIMRMIENTCKPFSHVLDQISMIQNAQMENKMMKIIEDVFTKKDVKEFISEKYMDIMRITHSDCISVADGEDVKSWGDTSIALTDDYIQIEKKKIRHGYSGSLENPLRGFMYFLEGNHKFILYRKSYKIDTFWGGDPNQDKILRPDGVPGPRGSFERFLIEKSPILDPWTRCEHKLFSILCERFRVFLRIRKKNMGDPVSSGGLFGKNSDIVLNSVEKTSVESFLLTHLSHELMTPLTGISNAMNIVLNDCDISRDETIVHMESGLNCVDMMHKSIRGVISTPSIEGDKCSGVKESEKLPFSSIGVMLESVISKYSNETKKLGIDFSLENHVDTDHDLVSNGHYNVVNSILSVIENSIRFTNSGGSIALSGRVHSTHREAVIRWKEETSNLSHRSMTNVNSVVNISDSMCWYTFTVSDSGSGIHQDMLNGVINTIDTSCSTLVPNGIKNSHQGVGIGLYRGLLDILNVDGTVAIASSLGKGTSVSFFIPLSVHIQVETNIVTNGVFFIVDDSKITRKMTSRLVEMACKKMGIDIDIQVFSDGKECIEEIMNLKKIGIKPIGILMDYHMPVMSGKEATESIRKMERENSIENIPILGYSADVTERTRCELLRSGMNGVLPKPLTMDILMNILSRIGGGMPLDN